MKYFILLVFFSCSKDFIHWHLRLYLLQRGEKDSFTLSVSVQPFLKWDRQGQEKIYSVHSSGSHSLQKSVLVDNTCWMSRLSRSRDCKDS